MYIFFDRCALRVGNHIPGKGYPQPSVPSRHCRHATCEGLWSDSLRSCMTTMAPLPSPISPLCTARWKSMVIAVLPLVSYYGDCSHPGIFDACCLGLSGEPTHGNSLVLARGSLITTGSRTWSAGWIRGESRRCSVPSLEGRERGTRPCF